MRTVVFIFALLIVSLCSMNAQAQTFPIKLHGHPQCEYYVADETPIDPGVTCHMVTVSSQGHWAAPSTNMMSWNLGSDPEGLTATDLLNPLSAHGGHLDCRSHFYGETNQPFLMHCVALLFHVAGHLRFVSSDVAGGISFDGGLTWHQGDVWSQPILTGNPMGIVSRPFTLWIDPSYFISIGATDAPHGWNPHGWTNVRAMERVFYDNGDQADTSLFMPFYSTWDMNAPEVNGGESKVPLFRAQTEPHSGGEGWGSILVQSNDILPILGSTSWPFWVFAQAYGQASGTAPPYLLECRTGLDLHAGLTGTRTCGPASGDASGNAWTYITPVAGKTAIIYRANTGEGVPGGFGAHKAVAALLVFNPLGGGPPPPPPPPPPQPVNCVQSDPYVTATSDSYTDWIIVVDHQERTKTTTTAWQRDTITPASNGGTCLLPSTFTTTTSVVEMQPLPPPPPPPCRPRGRSGQCK